VALVVVTPMLTREWTALLVIYLAQVVEQEHNFFLMVVLVIQAAAVFTEE
jgi:hypothetical protein